MKNWYLLLWLPVIQCKYPFLFPFWENSALNLGGQITMVLSRLQYLFRVNVLFIWNKYYGTNVHSASKPLWAGGRWTAWAAVFLAQGSYPASPTPVQHGESPRYRGKMTGRCCNTAQNLTQHLTAARKRFMSCLVKTRRRINRQYQQNMTPTGRDYMLVCSCSRPIISSKATHIKVLPTSYRHHCRTSVF